jgi:hypothetical protein
MPATARPKVVLAGAKAPAILIAMSVVGFGRPSQRSYAQTGQPAALALGPRRPRPRKRLQKVYSAVSQWFQGMSLILFFFR